MDSTLRRRPETSNPEKKGEKPPVKRVQHKFDRKRAEEIICAAADRVPAVAPYIKKTAPVIAFFLNLFFTLLPYLKIFYSHVEILIEKAKKYHLEELAEALLGIIYCFFGGSFMTLIAAIEAFRLCGWDRTKGCLAKLYANYKVVERENEIDNLLDEDDDGIADVDQIEAKELIIRKIRLVLIKCDPEEVSSAIAGINSGLIGVIATLKVRFAKSITLGASIANVLRSPCEKLLVPIFERIIPSEYHKWIRPMINYGCKTISISIAWFIARLISAFHSAIRGGQMLARGSMHYISFLGYLPKIDFEKTYIDEVIGAIFAFIGFYWQISSYFGLPFPLNIILFPLTCLEWVITWMVNS